MARLGAKSKLSASISPPSAIPKTDVEIVQQVARNMEKGIRQGLYRPDINVPLLSKLYVVRFEQAVGEQVAKLLQDHTMAEINWELFRYHIRGIANKKGIDHLEKKVTSIPRSTT